MPEEYPDPTAGKDDGGLSKAEKAKLKKLDKEHKKAGDLARKDARADRRQAAKLRRKGNVNKGGKITKKKGDKK